MKLRQGTGSVAEALLVPLLPSSSSLLLFSKAEMIKSAFTLAPNQENSLPEIPCIPGREVLQLKQKET